MKKTILILMIVLFSIIVNGQTKVHNACYKFLTENYGTVLAEDVDLFNTYVIFAFMPDYYTNDLMKEDVQTFVITSTDICLEEDWEHDEEVEGITCTLLVNKVERLTILYSDRFNFIYLYYKWNGMKE